MGRLNVKTNLNTCIHFLTFMAWNFPKNLEITKDLRTLANIYGMEVLKNLEITKYLRTLANIYGMEVSKKPGNYERPAYTC